MKKRLFRNSEVVTIKDALGLEWDIKEARVTKYGFDIYYGKRKDCTGYDVGDPNRLIYTNELKHSGRTVLSSTMEPYSICRLGAQP
jgi:hypothetical protein